MTRSVRVYVWLWLPDGSRMRVLTDEVRAWVRRGKSPTKRGAK